MEIAPFDPPTLKTLEPNIKFIGSPVKSFDCSINRHARDAPLFRAGDRVDGEGQTLTHFAENPMNEQIWYVITSETRDELL